jgi:hypothetical protein
MPNMASQKNTNKSQCPIPKIRKKDIVTGKGFEIPRKINPVNQIVKIKQKSEIEEAMAKQNVGIKDALDLF